MFSAIDRDWLGNYASSSGTCRALPTDDCQLLCQIKQLALAWLKPIGGKDFLWGPPGHLRKDRPSAGQPHIGRARQVEKIIAIEKHPEHVSAADDANSIVRSSKRGQGLLERSAGRVPEERLFIRWIGRDGRNPPS